MTNNGSEPHTYTIPAKVVGWAEDGAAKVEILSDTTDLTFRSVMTARVQKPTMGRKVSDFDGLKRKGLRTKGLVLLRKAILKDDCLEPREVEVLAPRDSEDTAFIFQRTACNVFPPAEGSQMATRARIAVLSDAILTETFTAGMTHVKSKLDQAGLFGCAGIIFCGRMKDGTYRELLFGGDEQRTPGELCEILFRDCPTDVKNESRTSSTKRERWAMIPFFEDEISEMRSSKLSAQRLNFDYGTPDAPRWTAGHVVMKMESGSWRIADATPFEGISEATDIHALASAFKSG